MKFSVTVNAEESAVRLREKKPPESAEQMYQPPCFLSPTWYCVAGLLYFSFPTVPYVRPLKRTRGAKVESV